MWPIRRDLQWIDHYDLRTRDVRDTHCFDQSVAKMSGNIVNGKLKEAKEVCGIQIEITYTGYLVTISLFFASKFQKWAINYLRRPWKKHLLRTPFRIKSDFAQIFPLHTAVDQLLLRSITLCFICKNNVNKTFSKSWIKL